MVPCLSQENLCKVKYRQSHRGFELGLPIALTMMINIMLIVPSSYASVSVEFESK